MEAVTKPELKPAMVPAARYPTMALHIDYVVLNLSRPTADGLMLGVSAHPELEVDIAIAPLDGFYWDLLATRKNKAPIDLDAWREPDWNSVKYCIAAGYPDEHKQRLDSDAGRKVANQLITVTAEVSSQLGRTERYITLSSKLEKPHGYYFSGMSGGPVYAVEGLEPNEAKDEELLPIGIIFQGFPSSGRDDVQASRDAARFLTERDLFFRAFTMTPEVFDEWLKDAGMERFIYLGCENASNHDHIRVLCMPLIKHVNRLAGMGSRFARKMTPPKFHLFEQNQCAG